MRVVLLAGLVAAAFVAAQLGSASVVGKSPTVGKVKLCLAYTPAVPQPLSSRALLVLLDNNAGTVRYSVFLFFGRTAAEASVLAETFLLRSAPIAKLSGPQSWKGQVGTISFVGFGPKALNYTHPPRRVQSAVAAQAKKLVLHCI
jgi:hypothetical protein